MNISLRITEAAKQWPHKKSVVFSRPLSGGGYEYPSYTFLEFEERSNQMANFFVSIGIKKGMRTLLFVTPRLDFSILTFALFKVGAVPVLIDPGMGVKNLLRSIKQVRPEALVSISKVHWLRRLLRDSFQDVKIKVSLSPVGGRTHHLYEKLGSFSKSFTAVEVTPEDPSSILFTSGGTGIPKGVSYTHGVLNSQTDALKKMFSLDETHTDLPGFPLFALFTLAMGMTSVIPDMDPTRPAQCDPKKLVQNILQNQATFLAGSPAIWERVGEYCLKKNIQLGSVKHLVMFGAPVRLDLHRMFKKILPFGDTFTPYGATEALPVTLVSGHEVLNSRSESGEGTLVGRPVPGTEVKIITVSDIPIQKFQEVDKGSIGEIIVSGDQVTQSYFEMPDETAKAKIIDQRGVLWHRMGDVGAMDEQGRLWFLGRKSHRVETVEEVFYPLAVEAHFLKHPEVRRAALVSYLQEGKTLPAIVVEMKDARSALSEKTMLELRDLIPLHLRGKVNQIFVHPKFPVDVRHNIKVDQLKLSRWVSGHHPRPSQEKRHGKEN